MTITLGADVERLQVIIVTGAGFAAQVTPGSDSDPYAVGSSMQLRFANTAATVWTTNTDVTAQTATWSIPAAQSDLIDNRTEVDLWYVLGSVGTLLARGRVKRS